MKLVTDAVNSSSPTKVKPKRNFHNNNPVPWWDSECERAKRLCRASFKKWQFSNELNDLINYKMYAAIARKTFKNKKRENFRKFAESIDFRTSPTYVWNKTKIFKNKWVKISPNVSQNLQLENIQKALDKLSPP